LCVTLVSSANAGPAADTLPAQLTDAEFWRIATEFSEPSGDYPYDNSYDYPDDYSGYINDGADYSPSQPYSYYNGYAPSGQYSNTVVSAVQSKLNSLGYYHGAIDGIDGDETQAALARYQQDQDLSVTGTVTPATIRALDLPYSAGL